MTTQVDTRALNILDPHHAASVLSHQPASTGGYPLPGKQSPTGTSAMSKNCFVDDNTWRLISENGEFDDIVVGSGFCGLAYIQKALELDPFRRILLLERGGFWLPDHFQNLPLPLQFVSQDVSETFPWELAQRTKQSGHYLNGSSPFFGGRSSFWSIWSPRGIEGAIDAAGDLMDDFPPFMKNIALDPDFYHDAEQLLHVKVAGPAVNADLFGVLQARFQAHLTANPLVGVTVAPAKLATGVTVGRPSPDSYRHFSAVGSILAINEQQNKLTMKQPQPRGNPLMIATNVVVERFDVEHFEDEDDEDAVPDMIARVLYTSRGPITLRSGRTNVILATGAIPATTILLNSIKNEIEERAGTRLTAHFRSQIKARFTPSALWLGGQNLPPDGPNSHPVLSAFHVRGRFATGDGHVPLTLQWHMQVTATYIPADWLDRVDHPSLNIQGLAPECDGAPDGAQLAGSGGQVIVSCSILGELPPGLSWVEFNPGDKDLTTNVRVNLELSDDAKLLWNHMEQQAFRVIDAITGAANETGLDYWNAYRDIPSWEEVRARNNIVNDVNNAKRVANGVYTNRVPAIFHEASTLYMTENFQALDAAADDEPSIDQTYRPYGLHLRGNVYVTGAGLFPTAGSWNPTPTICGFAQHLAKTLVIQKQLIDGDGSLVGGNTYWIKNRRMEGGVATETVLRLVNGAVNGNLDLVAHDPNDNNGRLWILHQVKPNRWAIQNDTVRNRFLALGDDGVVSGTEVQTTARQPQRKFLAPLWQIWWDGKPIVDGFHLRRIFADSKVRPTTLRFVALGAAPAVAEQWIDQHNIWVFQPDV